MHKGIHTEMAYRVIADWSQKKEALEFLEEGIAKPEWKKDKATRAKWLKEWMDMPDSNKHSSKLKNDHSYKLTKDGTRFRIIFVKGTDDQATVVARLKYSARDVKEWKVEEEYRSCALELAKSMHWVVDMSSPSHVIEGWKNVSGVDEHARVERDFDRLWKSWYVPSDVKFGRKNEIKDIYRWAKKKIEDNYQRNLQIRDLYEGGGSIAKGPGQALGKAVVQDIAQNIADYLAYIDRLISFDKVYKKLTGNGSPG